MTSDNQASPEHADVGLPAFEAFSDLMRAANVALAGAECHGLFTALLSLGQGDVPAQQITRLLWQEQKPQSIPADFSEQLQRMLIATGRSLTSDDFDFAMLLPVDEAPLDQRSRALAEWCSGYLLGMMETGYNDFDKLDPEVAEFARDLLEISRLSELDDIEGSDEDLMQLEEYVRVGVQLVHTNLQRPADSKHGMH